jgi:hypothetical protein
MLYIIAIIATVFIANNAVNSVDCRTVKQGAHYPSLFHFMVLNQTQIFHYGFNLQTVQQVT